MSDEAATPDTKKFFVGAYAAAPPVPDFAGSRDEVDYFAGLRRMAHVGGLELPFTGSLHASGIPRLADLLKENWKIAITPLPGQMQMMNADPFFGLASQDEGGRRRALDFFSVLADQMSELRSLRPDLEFIAVESHSGPRRVLSGARVGVSAEKLAESVEELARDPRLRGLLAIEHCDEWRDTRPVAKGFLSFDDELEIARKFQVGLVINWGRSVLETRSTAAPLEHVRRAAEAGVLRGLIFSGASDGHPLYGNWEDSHAPFREVCGGDESLLMTMREAGECVHAAGTRAFLGLKVQVLPRTAGVEERLRFLEANLRVLNRAAGTPPA